MKENEAIYKVYIHTNNANGKRYVGMTKLKPRVRFQGGHGYCNQPKFYNDIVQYGWDNFSHDIVKDHLTHNEARKLEADLIEEYKTYIPTFGYNTDHPQLDEQGEYISRYTPKYKNRLIHWIERDLYFNTQVEAAEAIGLTPSAISKVVRGVRPTAGGQHWEYVYID